MIEILRGKERKETSGTYSDLSFKVVLVRPNSSTSNSSIKKNEPADYSSLTLLNQRSMSFIKTEFKPCVTELSRISRHLAWLD